jgi:alkaline phosphatase
MHRPGKLLAALLLGAVSACAPAWSAAPMTAEAYRGAPKAERTSPARSSTAAEEEVRNVILFIGDGVGTTYWTAAWIASGGELAVQQMRVMGLTDTRSSDSYVTDSAAGATVYATGQRTYNGAIGVGPRCAELFHADSVAVMQNPAACDPLEGVFDIAYRKGIGTGLVATSAITHATPAAFGAKVPYRYHQPEIAAQLAANPIDVLLGGGLGFFNGSLRPDGVDLYTELCQMADCPVIPEQLRAYEPSDRRLIGLFAPNHMDRAARRDPTLPEMTHAALQRLSRNPRGFFLMVEGSQPDWRGHGNEPLPEVTAEMVDFDRSIGVGLEFARRTPGTLVLVVADHETGGLSIVEQGDTLASAYTTDYHTGEMTPHFAFGTGAERFAGIRRNDEIGRMLLEIVRRR